MTVKELKIGQFFTIKPLDNPSMKQVYIRGEYNRSSKKYSCGRFDDCSFEREFKGDKEVYIDFTF